MISIGNYNKIMSDRNIFNQIVYTPLSEALCLLEKRQKDKKLMVKVEKLLKGDIPEILKNKKCGVFARHVATPNFDTQRFIKLTRENKLETILCEYLDDKFTSNNNFKHSLGKIIINNGLNKNGVNIIEKINIIDFVKCDGEKIREILTHWKEPLVAFHRRLFEHYKLPKDISFYDISEWYKRNGKNASIYYTNLLLLFVANGILFENFLTNGKEKNFSKTTLLPAIENVINLVGVKPLIVPLDPIETEDEEYWISHPVLIKNFIPDK
jgi:hypothetical protein